jgi:ABC-type phosphate transport system substrate-binding protein
MPAFKQRLARIGASAGLLAATTAAIFAVGGASASSALAVEHCKGENIEAEGSSLQGASQVIWTSNPLVAGKGFNGNAAGCNAAGFPTARYTVTSSGTALKEWGAADGIFHKKADNYLGSDDGPAKVQLENMNTAVASEMSVIPVTQTSIAIVAHPPTGCTLSQISNANLEKAFRQEESGKVKIPTWKEIGGTATGSQCEVAVKRVVRKDSSGTSYHLKHYLFLIKNTNVACLRHGVPTPETWEQLQNATEAFGTTTKNQEWPECEIKSGEFNEVIRPTGTGGGEVVKTVDKTANSIGYAALPDAEANIETGTNILKVEDGEEAGVKKFASPAAAESTANCKGVEYTGLQNEGETESVAFTSKLHNLNWSKVYGTNPKVGGTLYPICTLTYDIAAVKSTTVFGEKKAQTIKDFFNYVIGAGQTDIAGKWYQVLPTGPAGAAKIAVEAIS